MPSDRVLRPKNILFAEHGLIEKDYHKTAINQRLVIHFVYINVMNCPDTDEWAGCDGTLCNIMNLLKIPSGSYGTVKHILEEMHRARAAGQEYVGDRQEGIYLFIYFNRHKRRRLPPK